ncbi:nucleoid-associated protein [Acetobacter sp. DmW_136]|uniref:nucleoid-associated protein n=1 Tax=Acetobacter sp. DmW_136 TaxID=2591091 RepID=UPI00123BB882|nr:nucleoid-associated protein [Acetobacter sp. DmW_136]KAA8388524.1 nucleoid-associated protein [Acetobacter sp. DmW_136]
MPIENLTVNRMCLHEVYRFGEDGVIVPPRYGTGLLALSPKAMSAFRSRVVAAFKSTAQCMDMAIREFGAGSIIELGARINNMCDTDFVIESRKFADALASAQTSRTIPGGLTVVFDGTHGYPEQPFFAIMKAELHEGFLKTADLKAEFVSDLFLSPKTKLYKIGLFTSNNTEPRPILPEGWTATVYDNSMSATKRDSAANYFHSKYLGLNIPDNAAQRVKQFFEQTRSFIKSSQISEEEKVDLLNSLFIYLKVDKSSTIQVSRFAESYMDDELAENYTSHMRREHFPDTAVPKDLSEIVARLRFRKLKFPRQITLQGPPESIRELVTVEPIEGDNGLNWTQLTIRGCLETQD